jgi:antitoxin component YwqK of YwqJK toxin-antitoxin module
MNHSWRQAYKPVILAIIFSLCGLTLYSQDTASADGYRIYHYPGGKISSEGTMKGGKPDGYWKSYFENGKLKSEGNRKNFELDSCWKFYNESGTLVLEVNYRNGKKNGIKTTYLEKEMIRENFKNDIKEGFTRYYYPEGTVKSEVPFVHGQEQGLGREFAPDGTVITLTEYKRGFIVERTRINRRDRNNLKQGRWFYFYDSGGIKSEGTFRDDKKNGYFKDYTESGDLIRVQKYIDDVLQKEAEEIQKLDVKNDYYASGKIKSTSMFRNGIQEGIMREFNEAGEIERAFLYKNGAVIGEGLIKEDGNRDGPWRDYYPDGKIRSEGKYDNGKQVGEWRYYFENGKTEQSGKFNKSGKTDGTWKWYYDNGQLRREENFRAGVKDGMSTEFDENGNTILEGEYVNGSEEGPWFELTGDVCIRGNYRDGLRNGPWSYAYIQRNGTVADTLLFFRGSFIEDNPDGRHTYYWDNGKIKDEGLYVMGKKEGDWLKYNYDGTLFMIVSFRDGVEVKYDGVKIKPAFEKTEEP